MIEYISPTSLTMFESNVEQFYMQYLAEPRRPRFPQTEPMSIGSAFDARVKCKLLEDLGKPFNVAEMMNDQVEEHVRDWAIENSVYVMNEYVKSGSYKALLKELKNSIIDPRFEFKVKIEVEGVPILGKPDCFYVNEDGARVIADWKVNGYCSKRGAGPKKGYVKNWTTGDSHPKAMIMPYHGIPINAAHPMEQIDKIWATQLTFYAWSLGEKVGGDFIAQIEQLACKPSGSSGVSEGINMGVNITVYTYRSRILSEFQTHLVERIKTMWSILQSDWIFRDRGKRASQAYCKQLNEQAAMELEMKDSEDPDDKYFLENVR
jgi:hypothetical protein